MMYKKNFKMNTFKKITQYIDSRNVKESRDVNEKPFAEALNRIPLQFPIETKKIIIVTGTNGKGSVAKTLETLLLSQGKKVGLFTSPHLISMTERIRLNGQNISESDFVNLFLKLEPLIRELDLSHFEILTLMASHYYFSPDKSTYLQSSDMAEWAIFEVAMGGMNDPTNLIPHKTAIITKLGYDHQQFLGSTLTEIAYQKFGIVSEHSTVFHHPFPTEVIPLAKEIKAKTDSQWQQTKFFEFTINKVHSFPTYSIETQWGRFNLALQGKRGAENSMLALTAFEGLGFEPHRCIDTLKQVIWPGRMEPIQWHSCACPVFLSGDHNVQGIESLTELIKDFHYQKIYFLAGIGKTKDAQQMLELLSQVPNSEIWLTSTPYKGRPLKDYGNAWLERAAGSSPDPLSAMEHIAHRAGPDDLLVITGSLYLVGHIMEKHVQLFASTKRSS